MRPVGTRRVGGGGTRFTATLVVAVGLAGCAVIRAYTGANEPLPQTPVAATRATGTLEVTKPPFPPSQAFVGVAMSGGGSRAANFSAAVLFALEEVGFLRYGTALSSVSGSSLAAAYWGLFGTRPEHWDRVKVRDLLRTDFEARWIFRWFWPHNIVRYWVTDFDRSDIMKEVFDRVLFHDATFAAMGAPESGPRIFLNATDFTTWQRFTFTDETFAGIGSRLDTYPISHAVMASGAFPGAFANVTLRDHRFSRPRHYTHLLDGGPTDNLGISTLLDIARALYRKPPGLRPSACFFFIVDAYAASEYDEPWARLTQRAGSDYTAPAVLRSDTRTVLDYFVDTNALAASNVLLYHSRLRLLREAGIDGRQSWADPVHEFPLFPGEPAETVSCMAWHVTYDRLLSSDFADAGHGALALRVASIVNRIPTRYKLTGPEGLTPETLQEALFDAARLLMKEDRTALMRVCQWFRTHGLVDLPGCSPQR